ncbi:ABC transporter permease [Frigoribacterium sp. PvP032]|uniref:ABC transporter permease n=1 Tax=Frigoribacterium sp. PvP032 TaxID=2806589 RepID=UPI001AE4FED4|nr:ABC transporter permease [Frigoribacterium sp. PvP032]MBP1190109.1 ABC-type antimicrobial peptide transport system permease subunit [Frigoribacterium sp. PvP032]
MFFTYLLRELRNRRKQTMIIAAGTALAIALVIVVSGVATGVRNAQSSVLESVYGVGTDVTITQTAEPGADGGGPGQQFAFGSGDGTTTDDGSTEVAQSTLSAARGTATFDSSALATVEGVDGVSAATATLSLQNSSFSGTLPDFSQGAAGGAGTDGATGSGTDTDTGTGTDGTDTGTQPAPPTGGADGAGGSAFDVDQFSVTGLDPSAAAVGPLTSASLVDGRALAADDAGTDVVVLDQTYATSAELAVGDTLAVGGTDFTVVGIVSSTSSDAATASDAYVPLDTAQALSGLTDQISDVYVTAASASGVDALKTDLQAALPDATVSTQSDLASSVSGSLSTASDLIGKLGTWLSVIVLAAAFLIAILFTVSGVSRRTREFGTLKAIGWSNARITRQVAGESIVQGLVGGVVGVAAGLVGLLVVNLVAPTLSAAATTAAAGPGAGGPGAATDAGGAAAAGGGGLGQQVAAATTDVVLHAPVTISVVLLAVGLAVVGGLLAGAAGGWRASRLRPAEALRSVA